MMTQYRKGSPSLASTFNFGNTTNCSSRSNRFNIKMITSTKRTLLCPILLCTIFTFCHLVGPARAYGVMSVDLGSEWMKVGLVAPNVPMDLVLNDQSNRKTSMAIAISNGERFIGDSALDVGIKYPERTFTNFLDLVGKTIDDESVKQYKLKFPHANISSHEPNSTSIVLNHPQGSSFTPLELVAMMLQLACDQVNNRLGLHERVRDLVVTVPPFFNSFEKKVVRDAARVVGLNVLRITHANAAFALSYGIFRHKDYLPEDSDNKTSIIFFDQGASQTSVTLADYHMIDQIDPYTRDLKNESLPTVSIRAQVFDRFLGGFDMQLRLRDHLVKAFVDETKIDAERIYKRGRSASKVLKEAGRVKRVLSANTDFMVRIENVIDDKDLRLPITRSDFEELNKDLLTTRITQLLDKLYEMPNVSRNERIESVIIVGGNTRTPKVQQVLLDYFKIDALGKSVNADEGAALAALYQAASLGRGFRVKKFALEEFGEQRVRYDPSKVIPATTTTTTPAPTTTEEPSTTTTTEAPVTIEEGADVGATETPGSEGATTTTTTTTTTPATTTTTASTTTEAPVVATTPDPEAIYSQSELDRISVKLAKMREDDFTRLAKLLKQNQDELDEIENERKRLEKESGASDEQAAAATSDAPTDTTQDPESVDATSKGGQAATEIKDEL